MPVCALPKRCFSLLRRAIAMPVKATPLHSGLHFADAVSCLVYLCRCFVLKSEPCRCPAVYSLAMPVRCLPMACTAMPLLCYPRFEKLRRCRTIRCLSPHYLRPVPCRLDLPLLMSELLCLRGIMLNGAMPLLFLTLPCRALPLQNKSPPCFAITLLNTSMPLLRFARPCPCGFIRNRTMPLLCRTNLTLSCPCFAP